MNEATSDLTSPERLSELSKSCQAPVRRGVALNPLTPYLTLLELAFSSDELTCINVYNNTSSDDAIKAACALNKPYVRLTRE